MNNFKMATMKIMKYAIFISIGVLQALNNRRVLQALNNRRVLQALNNRCDRMMMISVLEVIE